MTKKHETLATLRAAADAAVAKWHELDDVAKAKRKSYEMSNVRKDLFAPGTEEGLIDTQRKIAALEAEDAVEGARFAAVAALDAFELASCDELALARDAKLLHDDVLALELEESELAKTLEGVRQRLHERTFASAKADVMHAKRRADAGQPPSTATPRFARTMTSEAYIKVLAKRVASGEPRRDFSIALRSARAQELKIAGLLEQAEREEAAAKKEAAERKAANEENIRAQQRAVHENERAQQKVIDAEQHRREQLGRDRLAKMAP